LRGLCAIRHFQSLIAGCRSRCFQVFCGQVFLNVFYRAPLSPSQVISQLEKSRANVYVTGVNFISENVGTQTIRNFTITLQET